MWKMAKKKGNDDEVTVFEAEGGVLGIEVVKNALVTNLALGHHAYETSDERIRRRR